MIRCFTIPTPRRPLLVMVTTSRHGFSIGWGLQPKPFIDSSGNEWPIVKVRSYR